MKQVLIVGGETVVEEVPPPLVEPGTVLVAVEWSCISTGTELAGLASSGTPLWKRAVRDPEKVRRAVHSVATEGLGPTLERIRDQRSAATASGYSAAGVVLERGEGIEDLEPGTLVACAGAQCAHHAEVIRVPRNLAVPIPAGVSTEEACTVALGAIALQGVRRAEPTLGETLVVMGLGMIGQLTAQLLHASGCRVVAVDPRRERLGVAESLAAAIPVPAKVGEVVRRIRRITGETGADGVVITASSPSDRIVSEAFRMCRRRGRVVLVGDVGLRLQREDFYRDEIDFRISTSYGPGRYDPAYEHEGRDYPIAYVRWSEGRNMEAYLRAIAEGRIDVRALIGGRFPIVEAQAAYGALREEENPPLLALLGYGAREKGERPAAVVPNPRARAGRKGALGVSLIGAGAFARGMHLPNIRTMAAELHLRGIASRTGHNASSAAAQFGADFSTTDVAEILKDPGTDAVIIATRHNLHAQLALDALRAGKHVLVEKPLALEEEELDAIASFYRQSDDGKPPPLLLTGFNRRFSPHLVRLRQEIEGRIGPMVISYRMNAGFLPPGHWIHGVEGGGRNRGEACHAYDLLLFLTGSPVAQVHATALRPAARHSMNDENFTATINFEDGTLATLTYTALGGRACPKERLEVFCDGRVLVVDDYRELVIFDDRGARQALRATDKGHRALLLAFAGAARSGGEWPIPLVEQVRATRIALEVEKRIRSGSQVVD